MYRGRLIQRAAIVLERLDTEATSLVVGGGYDDRFGETIPVADGSQFGDDSVRFHDPDVIPCQVDRGIWGREEMTGGGEHVDTEAIFTLHLNDLERLGLVLPSGEVRIGLGDKISELRRPSGTLIISWADSPLYVTQVEDAGMGIDSAAGATRNLVFVHAKPDRKGQGRRT